MRYKKFEDFIFEKKFLVKKCDIKTLEEILLYLRKKFLIRKNEYNKCKGEARKTATASHLFA